MQVKVHYVGDGFPGWRVLHERVFDVVDFRQCMFHKEVTINISKEGIDPPIPSGLLKLALVSRGKTPAHYHLDQVVGELVSGDFDEELRKKRQAALAAIEAGNAPS